MWGCKLITEVGKINHIAAMDVYMFHLRKNRPGYQESGVTFVREKQGCM